MIEKRCIFPGCPSEKSPAGFFRCPSMKLAHIREKNTLPSYLK